MGMPGGSGGGSPAMGMMGGLMPQALSNLPNTGVLGGTGAGQPGGMSGSTPPDAFMNQQTDALSQMNLLMKLKGAMPLVQGLMGGRR